jgi:DNA-binding NarL/FixJ family response regulator
VELSFLTAVPSFGAIDCTTGRGQPLLRASEAVLSYSVLIVDDSALIRHSLRCCLEQDPDWRVCGEAEDGKVAVEKVKELHPDIVILDLQMPEMYGLAAARQITAIAPETAMVMFTMLSDGQLLKAARAAGIEGCCVKVRGDRRSFIQFAEKCEQPLE